MYETSFRHVLELSLPEISALGRLSIDNLSSSGIIVAVRIAPAGNVTSRVASNRVVKCVRQRVMRVPTVLRQARLSV